jgi:hypothetical protein
MYLPTVLTKDKSLAPTSEGTRKQGLFGKAKAMLRSRTRQMTTRQMTKEEEQLQGKMFLNKLQEQTPMSSVQSFQGFTGGHIVQQKR